MQILSNPGSMSTRCIYKTCKKHKKNELIGIVSLPRQAKQTKQIKCIPPYLVKDFFIINDMNFNKNENGFMKLDSLRSLMTSLFKPVG